MDVKIFVVTQKKVFDLPIGGGYYWIQSGAALGKLIPGIVHDNDSDDNRSKKNPLYSEYSAHYYIWKNTNSDVVGISHYRRFFDNGSFFIKPIKKTQVYLIYPYWIIINFVLCYLTNKTSTCKTYSIISK